MRRNVIKVMAGLLVAAAFGLAGCGGGGVTTSGGQSNATNTGGTSNSTSYFPLTVGSSWQYKHTLSSSSSTSTLTETVEVQNDGRLKTNKGDYYTFTSTVNGIYQTKRETSQGTLTYTPGAWLVPANMSIGNVISTNVSYTSTATNSQPGSFTETTTVVGTESVTVPAGTFNAIKIKEELNTSVPETRYYWYVQGIGLVKDMMEKNAITPGYTNELLSYTIK